MPKGLSVGLVVAAAIEVADESGLAAVTMAAVAQRCGFTTMSLYRHVASKDELVRRMLDEVLGTAPTLESTDWRAGLEQWSRAMLAILDRHPWGIDIPITGILGTHAQLSWLDRGLEAMAETGLDDGSKAEIVLLLNGYVFWALRLEVALTTAPPQPLVPPQFDLEDLPYLRRAYQDRQFEGDSTPEEHFRLGLNRTLDGIAASIP